MANSCNILVFLPNWVGDVVMATPALRGLRKALPQARITYFGKKVALDTLSGSPWSDAAIEDESFKAPRLRSFLRTAGKIRSGKFDLAMLLPNSFRTAVLARLGGIKRVAGYARDGRSFLLSDKLAPERANGKFVPVPTIDYYNQLAARLGATELSWQMELSVADADRQQADAILREAAAQFPQAGHGPLVMLNPGASFGPSKLWPADRYAAVADALIEQHQASILINAAPSEVPIAAAVEAAMKHRPLVNFATRKNTLGLLKAFLSRCDLLITNDTGARHFGAALGCRLVTIFGSTDPVWAQIDYPLERMIRVSVPCSPCQSKVCKMPPGPTFHQCMTAIGPDMVLAAANELLTKYPQRKDRP